MKLDAINLNLLFALEALLAEGSVTRAATRVGVTQPSMSNALAQLRRLFDDPLLVRDGAKMVPTARARELATPLADAMLRLRTAIEGPPTFDPESAETRFRIIANDYIEWLIAPRLLRRLGRIAPRVQIRFDRPSTLFEMPADSLASGAADAALGFYDETRLAGTKLLAQKLLEERMVCVLRSGAAPQRLTTREYFKRSHIRLIYGSEGSEGLLDVVLRSAGKQRNVAVVVASFLAIPAVAASTDLVGVIPQRLARHAARRLPLRMFDAPMIVPRTPVTLIWHEHRQWDPGHAWLRAEIAAACDGK